MQRVKSHNKRFLQIVNRDKKKYRLLKNTYSILHYKLQIELFISLLKRMPIRETGVGPSTAKPLTA